MKTTGIVYLVFWLMITVPLICFNLKKMWIKNPGEPKRFNWKVFTVVTVVFVAASAFLFSAWRVTLNIRYEITAEQYLSAQGEYYTGSRPQEELQKELEAFVTADFDSAQDNASFPYGEAGQVKFQIGDQINAKYAAKGSLPEPSKEQWDNTIYAFYLLDVDGQQSYYYLRMICQEDDRWLIDCNVKATEEQVAANQKYFANAETGIWHTVEKAG